MAHIITITGPSMCGKSTVIEQMEIISQSKKYKGKFEIVKIPKYTTRAFRANEIDAIRNKDYKSIDVLPVVGEYNELTNLSGSDLREKNYMSLKIKNVILFMNNMESAMVLD